jgi:hypothetical protein
MKFILTSPYDAEDEDRYMDYGMEITHTYRT